MLPFFRLWFGLMTRCFRSHSTLLLENLALPQQLAVLKRRHPRARLRPIDKLFLVLARRFWADWKKSLLVVTPETVVRWHRAGFRLYCFFIISHERRQILHVNVTRHPTSTWIAQQLREAFPYESAPSFLLFDHDQKYGLEVPAALRSLQITAVQTSIQSPWQNGVAERWVGSCRRDLLDHIIALNERHLKRLLAAYTSYYHDDCMHLGLHKETPGRR